MEKLLSQALSGIDTIVHHVCPPGTPSPTSKKRKTSTPEVAAAATATTAVTNGSTKNVNDELMSPKRTIDWETLLRRMNCGAFVQEVVWCNVTFHPDHFLPVVQSDSQKRKGNLRKLRLIATSVFEGMEEVAECAEKDVFLRSKVPRGTTPGEFVARTKWLKHAKSTASKVAIKFAKSIIKRLLVANGNYTEDEFRNMFNNQKLDVGPLY